MRSLRLSLLLLVGVLGAGVGVIALVYAWDDDVDQTEWRLTEPPAGDTLEIEVALGHSCYSFERIDLGETDDAVSIKAYRRHNSESNGCDDLMGIERHTITLASALGDRKLYGCDQGADLLAFPDATDGGCAATYR